MSFQKTDAGREAKRHKEHLHKSKAGYPDGKGTQRETKLQKRADHQLMDIGMMIRSLPG